MAQMLIANRLGDGLVVFRAADGGWVESINAGQVIEDADEINVTLATFEEYEAKVIGRDPKSDLALIKIETESSNYKSSEDNFYIFRLQ